MTGTTSRDRTAPLARLSPLVLVAVAMPWVLEWATVRGITVFAPEYTGAVTQGVIDAVLYPVVTGSLVLACLWAVLDTQARRSVFPSRLPSRRELFVVPVAGIFASVVGIIATGLAILAMTLLGVGGEAAGNAGLSETVDAGFVFWFVISSAVFAPVVEETLFRGLLLGYLLERGFSGVAAGGVVVASFGLIHLYAGPRVVGAAAVGAVLVWLRLRYDSVAVPVGVHAVNNLVTFTVLVLAMG